MITNGTTELVSMLMDDATKKISHFVNSNTNSVNSNDYIALMQMVANRLVIDGHFTIDQIRNAIDYPPTAVRRYHR